MHSNLHYALYEAMAADRVRQAAPRRNPPAAPAPAASYAGARGLRSRPGWPAGSTPSRPGARSPDPLRRS